ncbi:MAG: chromosome segregation protein SMC [Clostridia bacterium]|nr:chromosome segregation protein SMC [Clostridia bacterium]
MRLKTLEMQGFKSFPEKTVMNFDHGVTAVVGPNGSGKSNISDAMRWVLGEVSSRSIRGTKMEDVIFGGTDNRRPMGFCEVSLTIDNTDPENRMNIEYDEVTVTRRYYRSGDSEYFINHNPVRLKDINELFMNTGIGRSGYSIVSQGKAAEIISQKSDERRIIFEDAAGIAKYRYKKNEAERKLAAVEDNLVRIGDIIGELGSRVGPLEKESEKARKYLDIYGRKKTAEVALSIFDISNIKNKQSKLESDYGIAVRELESADSDLRSNEQRTEKLFESIQADKLRYEELFRLTREANEERLRIESSGKVYENEILHVTEQRKAASEQLSALNEEKEANTAAQKDAAATLETRKDELVSHVEKYEELCKQIGEKDVQIDRASDELEEIGQKLESLSEELTEKKIERSTLEVSDRTDDEKRTSLSAEQDELAGNMELLRKRIEQSSETVSGYQSNIAELDEQISKCKSEEDALVKELAHASDRVNALTVDVNSLEHRAQTLERMEAQLDGYSHAVRRVMSAAADGELHGIYGPVSKIITTASKYSTAIESALGATMQHVVTDTEADTKRAIHYLRDNKAGRTTFYPVATIKASPLSTGGFDYRSYKGYVGMANELAECDRKFENIKDYLLCRTVVFDDLDNANAMARASGFKIRVVTLDGQLINTGGSFTGGSAIRESGMLTRHNDIAKIKSEIEAKKNELVAASEKRGEIEKKLESKRGETDDVTARRSLFASLVSAENAQKSMLETQLASDAERRTTLEMAISGIDDDILRAKKTYEETAARIEEIAKEIEDLGAVEREKEELRRSLTGEQEALRRDANDVQLKIAEARKDVETAENALTDANARLETTSIRIAETENALLVCDQRMEEFTRMKDEGVNASSDIADKLRAYEAESRAISERNLENEKLQTELREENKSLSHRREILFRNYTKLESDMASAASEQDKLTEHLWEEYELTYSAALELELPEVNEENRKSFAATVSELRGKLRQMGSVNVGAIEEYAEVKERYDFMKGQFDDLTKSREELGGVIYKLEKEMRERFITVFEEINKNFKVVFKELFGGGSANISLSDPDNVLTSGIEIEVAPPGKIIKNLNLLSGGEQAFVAIALFFSILKVNPTPFCVLDEIEAALDEVNVARFAEYCRKFSDRTQFILITHRRGSMESADMMYGITMYERGVSKVLSVNVNEVEKKIGVKL